MTKKSDDEYEIKVGTVVQVSIWSPDTEEHRVYCGSVREIHGAVGGDYAQFFLPWMLDIGLVRCSKITPEWINLNIADDIKGPWIRLILDGITDESELPPMSTELEPGEQAARDWEQLRDGEQREGMRVAWRAGITRLLSSVRNEERVAAMGIAEQTALLDALTRAITLERTFDDE